MADEDFLKLLEHTLFGLDSEPVKKTEASAPGKTKKSASEIRGAPVGGATAVKPATAQPVAVSAKPMVTIVGSDYQTKAFFDSTFGAEVDLQSTMDLAAVKAALVAGEIDLLVFDPTAAVKPGVAITRYIKEKALPVSVVHVQSAATDESEEYAKYRLYHLHLLPDFQVRASELATLSAPLRKLLNL